MFYQIFFSPQLKRCTIITYMHSIYELPHEVRLTKLRKNQESLKTSQNTSLVPSLPVKMKILLILAKNS